MTWGRRRTRLVLQLDPDGDARRRLQDVRRHEVRANGLRDQVRGREAGQHEDRGQEHRVQRRRRLAEVPHRHADDGDHVSGRLGHVVEDHDEDEHRGHEPRARNRVAEPRRPGQRQEQQHQAGGDHQVLRRPQAEPRVQPSHHRQACLRGVIVQEESDPAPVKERQVLRRNDDQRREQECNRPEGGPAQEPSSPLVREARQHREEAERLREACRHGEQRGNSRAAAFPRRERTEHESRHQAVALRGLHRADQGEEHEPQDPGSPPRVERRHPHHRAEDRRGVDHVPDDCAEAVRKNRDRRHEQRIGRRVLEEVALLQRERRVEILAGEQVEERVPEGDVVLERRVDPPARLDAAERHLLQRHGHGGEQVEAQQDAWVCEVRRGLLRDDRPHDGSRVVTACGR